MARSSNMPHFIIDVNHRLPTFAWLSVQMAEEVHIKTRMVDKYVFRSHGFLHVPTSHMLVSERTMDGNTREIIAEYEGSLLPTEVILETGGIPLMTSQVPFLDATPSMTPVIPAYTVKVDTDSKMLPDPVVRTRGYTSVIWKNVMATVPDPYVLVERWEVGGTEPFDVDRVSFSFIPFLSCKTIEVRQEVFYNLQ